MNLQRCFEILDLPPDASLKEAKQAYRDIVAVWHPDRFPHNPRLRRRAEQKVKEINIAFAEVKACLSRGAGGKTEGFNDPAGGGGAPEPTPQAAEVIAESATRLVLNLWAYLSRSVARAVPGGNRQTRRERPSTDPAEV